MHISLLLLLPSLISCSSSVPSNPFLSSSAWSIAQLNNYAQASSQLPGPTEAGDVDVLFHTDVAGALTVLYTEDEKVVWGSSLTSVFKVDRSHNDLRLIDSVEKPKSSRQKDTFRGIYSVLTKEGYFYISSGNSIFKYADKIRGDSLSGIDSYVQTYEYMGRERERVLALSLSYDGKIVFITNQGGVGILSPALDTLIDFKHATAGNGSAPEVSVTNSVSIDEFGGIYIVTSSYMHRMWWDVDAQQLHSVPPPSSDVPSAPPTVEDVNMWISQFGSFELACPSSEWGTKKCQVWSTPYAIHDEPIFGRPTRVGSGTTPSLLKDATSEELFVVIADGQVNQQVLAFSSMTGEIVATAPVDFKDNRSSESYTEQSILVNGNKLLLTQNALTDSGQRVNDFLDHINASDIVESMDLPEFVLENIYLLPVVLGDSPRGFQQFEFALSGKGQGTLKETWSRNDIGCPNAIPTMSEPTGVMYCVGKSTSILNEVISKGMTAGWTVEAFDWNNGQSIFSAATGSNLLYNSLYAATQIGPEKEIIHGSTGGLVRLRAPTPTSSNALLSSILHSSLSFIRGSRVNNARDTNVLSAAADVRAKVEALAGRTGVEVVVKDVGDIVKGVGDKVKEIV
eukprot:GHVS01090301.1.p1 GENE.GHVS01090301.1~~GHVS01090301.1.p1  ORF type:complete len:625 (+),score=106.19 GHVS01090301.1:186-2060(+)